MKRKTKVFEFFLLILFAVLMIGVTSIFAGERHLIKEKTLPTKPGETLTVEASGADVNIESWDRDEAYVKILGNKNAEEKLRIEIEKTDDGISVIAKKKSSWFSWWSSSNFNLRIEVKIPAKYNSEVSTSGGDIDLSNVSGDTELHTSGGDVKLSNTAGKLVAGTSGGDIKIDTHKGDTQLSTSGGDITTLRCDGDMKASTSGGDIRLDIANGRIHAKTSGGDIDINYDGENKGIVSSTSGGSINVRIPSTFKADVYLSTSGGSIENEFTNARTSKVTRSSLKSQFNGGGETLECKTSGGSIRVFER